MTLVLSQLRHNGIAMAADSAVTFQTKLPNGKIRYRVLQGARKLQMLPHIKAGISCWGLGQIGQLDTDIWLEEFIRRSVNKSNDIHSFASLLSKELNNVFPRKSPRCGFHLAAYDKEGRVFTFHYKIRLC